MNKFAQREQEAIVQEDQESQDDKNDEIEEDSSDSEGERKKIGDKLFDDGEEKAKAATDFKALAKEMSSEMLE